MGFDEPQPLIYSTRNLREHVGGDHVVEAVGLDDGVAGGATERRECTRHSLDMTSSFRKLERIFIQPRD